MSDWLKLIKQIKKQLPNLQLKEIMKKASAIYKKK